MAPRIVLIRLSMLSDTHFLLSVTHFFRLSAARKEQLLSEQKLASDGILADLLESIYRRLYALEIRDGISNPCELYPGAELIDMKRDREGYALTFNRANHDNTRTIHADVVVLCTGFTFRLPDYLEPLAGRLKRENGHLRIREDFSLEWDGPEHLAIYAQNVARQTRGIADPNLSLTAWRSGKIVNSLMKRRVYDIDEKQTFVCWNGNAS